MDLTTSAPFQRFESGFKQLYSEYNLTKEDLNEVKRELENVIEENRKLRRELKDCVANQLSPSELQALGGGSKGSSAVQALISGVSASGTMDSFDQARFANMDKQLKLLASERDNAMQMWQSSLAIIAQLEQELKTLQYRTAPQTMSFDIELKQKQEEFARMETHLLKEVAVYKAELSKKEDEVNELKLKMGEFRLQMENLTAQLSQKDQDKRNLIKKEYGYDDALISLQNDINDLETKNQVAHKDNQHLRENNRDLVNKINELNRHIADLERKNADVKAKLDDALFRNQGADNEQDKIRLLNQRNEEDHNRMHTVLNELMNEAAEKTKREIESLKAIYNRNIEKMIDECSMLETDRNNKEAQLEKALRTKKALEQELEKIASEALMLKSKENLTHEDLHRRMCAIEREKEQAVMRLETREAELKKLQDQYEVDKQKNQEMLDGFKEKTFQATRGLEKLTEEHTRLLGDLNELKDKYTTLQAERDQLQQKLTKQIQLSETEMSVKTSDYLTKVKCLEDNHAKAMFDLRQLLNMQQRMSNKWKEECHTITKQSELKFIEIKKNYDNLKQSNERLMAELNDFRRRQLENERERGVYMSRIKSLEERAKDAELQATEATKRATKQMAREKLVQYEKHLIESDLERVKFNDSLAKGKFVLKEPILPKSKTTNKSEEAPERLAPNKKSLLDVSSSSSAD